MYVCVLCVVCVLDVVVVVVCVGVEWSAHADCSLAAGGVSAVRGFQDVQAHSPWRPRHWCR